MTCLNQGYLNLICGGSGRGGFESQWYYTLYMYAKYNIRNIFTSWIPQSKWGGGSLGPNPATPTKPQRPMWPRLFLTGFQFAPLIRSGGKEGDNHATERINFFETSHGDCEHLQMGLDQYITWTFQWMAKKSLHKFKGRERRVIANEAGYDSSSIMAKCQDGT